MKNQAYGVNTQGNLQDMVSGVGCLRGMGMGMGMGMGPSRDLGPAYSPLHVSHGVSLMFRHEWEDTVYLVEFLTKTHWQEKIEVEDPPGPEQTKTEIERLHKLQTHDGLQDRIRDIIAEVEDYTALFENICFFDGHSHPKTQRLMQTVILIGWTVVQHYKAYFDRKRPSYVDPTLKPIIRVPTFPAYPSGHATQAYLIYRALEKVIDREDPEFGDQLMLVAQRIAKNREWAGVHYESDTKAGEKLAEQIWLLMAGNKRFKQLISKAKGEWTEEEPDSTTEKRTDIAKLTNTT